MEAEDFTHQSPFVYADNNPVRFIDFLGMNAQHPDSLTESIFRQILNQEKETERQIVESTGTEAFRTWDYGIPIWGAARLSSEAWDEGQYFHSVGWFLMGVAEGLSLGTLCLETQAYKMAAVGTRVAGRMTKGGALVTMYPSSAAITGTTERTFLMPGQIIDRYGSLSGNWFSTPGTSYGARSIPPGLSPYSRFQVVKPFEVQKSFASPGMLNGQTGFGIQFQSAVGADVLIKREIIIPFKP